MDNKRRNFLKAGLVIGGTGAFAAGYAEKGKSMLEGAITGTSGEETKHPHFGNSLSPEYTVKNGKLVANPDQRVVPSMCLGCWTLCGVRLRVDNKTDDILRISGNPYHPLSSEHQIAFETPVKDAYLSLTGEAGIEGRSTACARGNAMMDVQNSPYRIKTPLKRVGARGEGKWEAISYEQLIKEITQGGDLFGEGHVEGLKDIRDLKTPVDPKNPEYGPKANQLLVTNGTNEGRDDIIKRFAFNSFGTRNFANHGSYCGYALRAGAGAFTNDLENFSHLKPDYDNAEFALFIGTAPSQAGNPFKRQARQIARARTRENFEYVVVTPTLQVSTSLATGNNNHWLAIKSGTDSALVLAIIQWMFEHEVYNKTFLEQPSAAAMKAADQKHWCNATHLVIESDSHPRKGGFLRASDMGLEIQGEALSAADPYMVVDKASGELVANTTDKPAQLFASLEVETTQGKVQVRSSLAQLKQAANEYTLDEYSQFCGIDADKIVELAAKFSKHGTKSVVDTHGGNMHSNGFYNAYAIMMLNAMVGNINQPGGMFAKAGGYPTAAEGPRYDFMQFDGKVAPSGVFLSRSKFPYQKTSEYKRRVEAGESPYPTRAPWYPISSPLLTEHLSAAIDGYPYRVKAWINHMANPLYGVPGLNTLLKDKLKDPKQLGLIVSVDAFINETSAISDYIVPDTVTYESWGMAGPWHDVKTKAVTARWPAVAPRTDKTQDGRSICLEDFLIDVAKALELGGFGDKSIKDAQGNWHGIHTAADYYMRSAANLAYVAGGVPDATAEDIHFSGVEQILSQMQHTLTPEELKKVAFIFARGGRFENLTKSIIDGEFKYKWEKPVAIWNETLGTSTNTMTGEQYSGCPKWYTQRLADGTSYDEQFPASEWQFTLTNFKSNVHSAVSNLSPRLNAVKGDNPVYIHPVDAERFGIETGDSFEIETPTAKLVATAMIVDGIHQGTLGFEHGFGHTELGERAHWIDGKQQAVKMKSHDGVNINDIGMIDPTRNSNGVVLDWVIGSAVRQALPAKIRKA